MPTGRNQGNDRFRRPEVFLADIINKGVRGEYREETDNQRVWYRATVVAVDIEGGNLENPSAEGSLQHVIGGHTVTVPARLGPRNPRNSVKARILTDEFDQYTSDDQLSVFWPMFPDHDAIPIKPGEHVYVTFEDGDFEHGLWIGKVAGHEGVNYSRGEKFLESSSEGSLAGLFEDTGEPPVVTYADDKGASGRFVSRDKASLFGD